MSNILTWANLYFKIKVHMPGLDEPDRLQASKHPHRSA